MDKQKSAAYSPRPAARQAEPTRRPSGFGTTGQTRKKPAPAPEPQKATKPAKEKKIRKEREPGKNRPLLRILLAVIAVIVLVSVLMVLIFGGEDTTYHQMPTIEYESIAHFEPEATPIPGTEGL